MQKLFLHGFVLLTSFSTLTLSAQKIKMVSGNKHPIAPEQSINVEFSYDSMSVGKFANESDYVQKKKAELNKKQQGRGDSWEQRWIADRSARFEPKFLELFSKYSHRQLLAASKYTLVFHTTFTEPGFYVYTYVHEKARISGEAWIVETADRSHVLARIAIDNVPGRSAWGADYDTGLRIQEAYAKAGKSVGKYLQ